MSHQSSLLFTARSARVATPRAPEPGAPPHLGGDLDEEGPFGVPLYTVELEADADAPTLTAAPLDEDLLQLVPCTTKAVNQAVSFVSMVP